MISLSGEEKKKRKEGKKKKTNSYVQTIQYSEYFDESKETGIGLYHKACLSLHIIFFFQDIYF